MAVLADYQNLAWYEQGLALIGDDFIEGRRLEMWVKELGYGQTKPPTTEITVDVAGAVTGATSATFTVPVGEDLKVYRGDTAIFDPAGNAEFILFDEDTTITNVGTLVQIAPLIQDLTGSATGFSYGMIPVRSLTEGGFFETTGTSAIARTKPMGLEPARKKIEIDGAINFTGQLYVKDPGLAVLQRLSRGARNAYVELRYATYITFTDDGGVDVNKGSGNGAIAGEFVVNYVNYPANRTDLIGVNGNMEQASAVTDYAIVTTASP